MLAACGQFLAEGVPGMAGLRRHLPGPEALPPRGSSADPS